MPPERPAARITASGRRVAFLDLPGLDADAVVAEIERALDPMPEDAVVSVFTDDPASEERVAAWGGRHGIETAAVIAHDDGGWTFALRPSSEPPLEPS